MSTEMITEHFSRAELQCRCGCGRIEIPAAFLTKIEDLRAACGWPLVVGSGYRCPNYNKVVSAGGTYDGPHTRGAIDIVISGEKAYRLLHYATIINFTGIGVRQRGPISKRIIHLDDLLSGNSAHPRPWLWSY